jgi:peroxiredoxin
VTLYNEILPEFRRCDAELLDISVDGVWCYAAFALDRHLHFPLLTDFAPKGEVATKYRACAGPALAPITLVEYGDYARIARWRIP